jgi:hypothetical protein
MFSHDKADCGWGTAGKVGSDDELAPGTARVGCTSECAPDLVDVEPKAWVVGDDGTVSGGAHIGAAMTGRPTSVGSCDGGIAEAEGTVSACSAVSSKVGRGSVTRGTRTENRSSGEGRTMGFVASMLNEGNPLKGAVGDVTAACGTDGVPSSMVLPNNRSGRGAGGEEATHVDTSWGSTCMGFDGVKSTEGSSSGDTVSQ